MEENTKEVSIGWQSDKPLSKSLVLLLEKELWTDVTFTFRSEEEVVEVKGHTVILAARSPVFQAMFFGQMERKREVEIEDASPESFKLFLKCLYTDDVDLDEESVIRVIEIAHKYQLGYLLDLCSEQLAKSIRVDNACHILNLAVFYNLNKLQKEACNFVDDHVHEILETPGFMNISVETLRVMLAGDTLYDEELNIFRKCVDWAENKCKEQNLEPSDQNKRNALGDAFFFLRLPSLSLFDYTENVANTNLLSTEESHKIYMYKGSPSLQMDLRNSIIQRKPRLATILLPGDQMEIKFNCPNDIYLLGVMLDQSKEYLHQYQVPSFYSTSDENNQPDRHLSAIALHGELVIQETGFNVTFQTPYLPKIPNFISLNEKVLLKGNNESYTITLKVTLCTSYNVLYLEQLRNIFVEEDNSLNRYQSQYRSICCDRESSQVRLLKILYKGWPCSKYQHFITGLQFQNVSNR
ncbi:hypothetical protein CHS0354_033828 [Potamilus streckersoni]|uniref:BTB domain-containing protein n=1 Tax=Potamilus streckersoni TaxID=2493646 RepID=A0AAE0W8T6_9BIVA|nr:hypothetical protein CHS0354_033828 [Potamilus streckersoni]